MKTLYLPLLLAAFFFNAAYSQNQTLQDAVYLKNGSIIRGTVMEMVPGKNVKVQMADGSLFVYDMNEVEKISKEPNAAQQGSPAATVNSMEKQGRIDASKYYRGYRGAQVGTLFASLFAGPFGLGIAIPGSIKAPKEESLYTDKHPDPSLFNNPEYKKGYTEKAHKMKRVKTWVSFGVGLGINAIFMGAVVTAHSNQGQGWEK